MNSRVGRLGGHSHDARNLTFLFRSREATTHRVYLNEVDTPLRVFRKLFPAGSSGRPSGPEVVCSQSLPSRDREGAVQGLSAYNLS